MPNLGNPILYRLSPEIDLIMFMRDVRELSLFS